MSDKRLPNIWVVSKNKFMSDEHSKLMPDDVLCHTGRYRFVSDSPLMTYSSYECCLYIDKTRTRRLANPLEYFSKVLADRSVTCIRVDLWVSRKSTRDLFPALNPMWAYVEVRYENGQRIDYAQVTTCSREFSLFDVPKWANNTTEPLGTLVVLPRDASVKDSVVKELGAPDKTIWVIDAEHSGDGLLYRNRPFHVLDTKHNEFNWLNSYLYPADKTTKITWSQELQKNVVNVTISRDQLIFTSHLLRWPRYRHQIFLTVLALAPLHLPPYVLLEILDWLPKMDYQPHRWKIDLIMSMTEHIREICQAREHANKMKMQRVD